MIDALGNPQSVLLLGGTSEIGLAIVDELATSGRLQRVVLAGRDDDALEREAGRLRDAGVGTVEVEPFDAATVASHASVVDGVFDRSGDVDVVIVAWGVLGDQATFEADPDAAVAAVTVNYTSAVSVGLRVAERLKRQGHGRLVVLSSVAGERARRSNFVYGSTKAGLDAFATGLGDALVGSGASVLVVRPGFVRGRMTAGLKPAPLSTTPEAVGKVVAKAIATGKEEVWAPPALRWVMSTLRHVPRPVFRKLPV